MTDSPKASKSLITPKFRVSFPEVWQKRAFQEGQTGRYSVTALFTPSEFSEADKLKWQALLAACNKVSLEIWKKPYNDVKKDGSYTVPFHKGEEKTYAGYGPGVIFCTLSAYTRRPTIVARDGVTQLVEGGPDEFYAGCYARASVNPFVPKKWKKTMALGMNNLQKLGEGERLDAYSSAEDDFGADPAEFAGDEASNEAGAEFDPTA